MQDTELESEYMRQRGWWSRGMLVFFSRICKRGSFDVSGSSLAGLSELKHHRVVFPSPVSGAFKIL